MKTFLIILLTGYITLTPAQAQDKYSTSGIGKNDTIRIALSVDEYGNKIPWVPLNDVFVYNYRLFPSPEARYKFNRLRYNVLKVLPYAKFARERYARLNDQLALNPNKKDQKKLVKSCEKEIKDMFNREIKNMTITQGEILIKLVDRETGNSSYELVRQLKGGFTAFFYQSIARVFGHNLKQKYDSGQDRDIEYIIQHAGYYNSGPYY